MCEDAPCCGCCSSAELWNPHPSDYEAWEEWEEERLPEEEVEEN
jgi:hypothetical protein